MKKLCLQVIALISIFPLLSCGTLSSGDNNIIERNQELLNEYNLLLIDLANVNTWGYKSYIKYDYKETRFWVSDIIDAAQGMFQQTGVPTDFAILGKGFFKIRLDNDAAGYTRNGNFKVDSEGNLVTREGYPLFDNIQFDELFLPDTISVAGDGKVSAGIPESGNIVMKEMGRLFVHYVPAELLVHKNDAIYVIKNGAEYNEEIVVVNAVNNDNNYKAIVLNDYLEMSNCSLTAISIRLLYILSVVDENTIQNREFKKELILKILFPENNIDNNVRYVLQYLRPDY